MVTNIVHKYLPREWSSRLDNLDGEDYKLVDILRYSSMYEVLKTRATGSFARSIEKIVRVENPYLYALFLLKKEEYQTRYSTIVQELFHDTAACKIPSIVSDNLDWRLARRVKFGEGVSFSPSCQYANCQSSRSNGSDRAMIVADVLVGRSEMVCYSKKLPGTRYDTSIGNLRNVYVKYYDNEFYPKYVVYYKNRC